MWVCIYATLRGSGEGGNAALNKGNRLMRFQTNIGYANSKTLDGIFFYGKTREIIVLCHINCRGRGGGSQLYSNGAERFGGMLLCKIEMYLAAEIK